MPGSSDRQSWSHDAEGAARVLERRPQRTGNGGFLVRCPAHNDHDPSLSISPRPEGGFLVNCFGGCDFKSICEALARKGIRMPYFQHGAGAPDAGAAPPPSRRRRGHPLGPQMRWAGPFDEWPPDNAFVHFELGKPVALWPYLDAHERLHAMMARYQFDGDKTYRPWSNWNYRYRQTPRATCRMPPAPRILYRLPELLAYARRTVLLVEGEKAANASRMLLPDLLATTYMGGSQAAGSADFEPLRHHQVIVVPDHDRGGELSIDLVAGRLDHFGIPHVVRELAREIPIQPGEDNERIKWDIHDLLKFGTTANDLTMWRHNLPATDPLHVSPQASPVQLPAIHPHSEV